ncbi:hypothetical protein PEC301877_40940 [Pectobacterium carotovorum subsp. carotovorum]|nr:hypothetical protein PEC301877_40940 [Pectobacterium carotovorum subsp. carotovorum]
MAMSDRGQTLMLHDNPFFFHFFNKYTRRSLLSGVNVFLILILLDANQASSNEANSFNRVFVIGR